VYGTSTCKVTTPRSEAVILSETCQLQPQPSHPHHRSLPRYVAQAILSLNGQENQSCHQHWNFFCRGSRMANDGRPVQLPRAVRMSSVSRRTTIRSYVVIDTICTWAATASAARTWASLDGLVTLNRYVQSATLWHANFRLGKGIHPQPVRPAGQSFGEIKTLRKECQVYAARVPPSMTRTGPRKGEEVVCGGGSGWHQCFLRG
jgi:hypothetical protein